ncbi:phospho-N-acetylmuramoyl-pentapeptide-transferase [Winogradskyella sp. F6397]|uniref:Phospho-N-acetylmuramoyl-pentapeptide-transferase n=1 Tax=Winogradskyella marina TaxID=2785530 RepID=A0ABS0EIQ5_9FLAO|nr:MULTISPECIES: phospho-N-acetylmuramoyl-pentapeptide-transferase [Winogradskyella]MBF8148541.1 phospho-N-acetylmuramoyl-pentapeptide-transferase [Winogradskyella marina]
MLYYLFEYLEQQFQLPGASLFGFITFRAAVAIILSLLISTIFGKRIIRFLQKQQVGETIRDLGLEGQVEKAGTPTMGGIIIILATLIPVLLLAKLENIYIILLIVTTLWMGTIGFIDDYIKKFKNDKEGLKGKFKVLGQVGLGIIVGATLFFHQDVTIKEKLPIAQQNELRTSNPDVQATKLFKEETKSTKTTIPFAKDNEFNYSDLITWISPELEKYAWIVFILVSIFIITAVSNGANLTDGIDGLAAGTSAIIVLTLGIFAWVSSNIVFSGYLDIMYIPRAEEITIYIAAFVGALVGFLWYNTYPAQVFMGDTGSLTIGGIIAVIAIAVRKEWLIPILCGIFLAENLSVVLQVSYFKYTRKKFGEGRRIFKMSPLHHHYQKSGYHESKIVTRFWIVGILLAIITIVTLKIR